MPFPRRSLGIVILILVFTTRMLSARERSEKPNIIIIFIDDMGWKDTSFAGNTVIETPNLDELAGRGMIFNQAYAAAPNCAPSRASLLTGLYPPRHGIYTVVDERHSPGQLHHPILASESQASLDSDAYTIAEAMSDNGYRTGMVGMWNLGRGKNGPETPTGQGFETYIEPRDLGFEPDAYKNKDGEFLTNRLTDSAIDMVQDHRDDPFFLYLAYHAIHGPFNPEAPLMQKYEEIAEGQDLPGDFPEYAATVETLDQNIGRLWEYIASLNLAENTYLFFTSDNGGIHQYTSPLREGKGTLYEGGIRVPMFICGPGITSDIRSDIPVSSIDIFPTILDIIGSQSITLDGMSLFPILEGTATHERENLFWHFPCYIGRGEPVSAVRSGNYKLLEFFETGNIELYNLALDPGEQLNLANIEPEIAERLYRILRSWHDSTGAPRPGILNPFFDPDAAKPDDKRGIKPQEERS